MVKQGLLFEVLRAAGAIFSEGPGGQAPAHFGDPRGEYDAVRKAAGLLNLSHHGKIRITGADRTDFLHRMLSADVKGLGAGQGCKTFLLDAKGHVVAYISLYALEDAFLAEAEPPVVLAMVETLERYIIADDVTLEDVSETYGLLSVQGPAAPAVLADLLGGETPALQPMQHVERELTGEPVRIVSKSRTGEAGFDLWVAAERAAALWEAAAKVGERHDLRPVGLSALNTLRLEAGQAWAGDVGGDVLAMETGLEHAISFTKGCYIGQEFVIRVAHRGHVNRKLSGLLVNGGRVPAAGDKVVAGGKEVGWITSAAFSPAAGRPIALGYVRREHNEPGAKVAVNIDGSLAEAEVVALPFLKTVQ